MWIGIHGKVYICIGMNFLKAHCAYYSLLDGMDSGGTLAFLLRIQPGMHSYWLEIPLLMFIIPRPVIFFRILFLLWTSFWRT
jgi:hypothetical protein